MPIFMNHPRLAARYRLMAVLVWMCLLAWGAVPGFAEHPATRSGELRFAVAGDIMAHESQLESAYDETCGCYNFQPVFADVMPLFKEVDVAIANLETTLPGKNYSGYPAFGAPDTLVDAIQSSGINLLTTANNHCMDKGKDALIRTLRVLDEKKIPHLGTYASPADYNQHHVFLLKKNDMTVALLDYTYGTNDIPIPEEVVVSLIDKEKISQDIASARKQKVDAVIVLFHFGREYLNSPDAFQREMVEFALEKGADVVLGGHPHHVQPYQKRTVKDQEGRETQRLVAYSVGNFVSAQRKPYTDGGMVLYFTLVKKSDAAGGGTLDITGVHHKLVWVYVESGPRRKQFHILPVESYLAAQKPQLKPQAQTAQTAQTAQLKLPKNALLSMKQFNKRVEKVLKAKVGPAPKQPVAGPEKELTGG